MVICTMLYPLDQPASKLGNFPTWEVQAFDASPSSRLPGLALIKQPLSKGMTPAKQSISFALVKHAFAKQAQAVADPSAWR